MRAIYDAFLAAKNQMEEQYVKGMTFNNMTIMMPWLTKHVGDFREVLGADWWPYGIGANRAAIDAVLRYHYDTTLRSAGTRSRTSSSRTCSTRKREGAGS